MSVSTTIIPALSQYPFPYPKGVTPWYVDSALSGDVSGGSLKFDLNFNPDSDRKYQPWIYLTRLEVYSTAADIGNGAVQISGTYFEPMTAFVRAIPIVTAAFTVSAAAAYGAVLDVPTFFGRVRAGQSGTVSVLFANVNTAVVNLYARGLIAERPIVQWRERIWA